MNLELDKYIVKVLTHGEMRVIKEFTKTIYCSKGDLHTFYFKENEYFNADCKSVVLCYPQTIEKNIEAIKEGNDSIIFISDTSYMDLYYNPQIWFCAEYSSPSIKDILIGDFCIANFDTTAHYYIREYGEHENGVNKKIIIHFQEIFMLLKEMCNINDIQNYIFAILFSKISFNKKKIKDEPYFGTWNTPKANLIINKN